MTRNILTIHYGPLGAKVIPNIPLVTTQPRRLNERLWELHRKAADRTITPEESAELDMLCDELEKGNG